MTTKHKGMRSARVHFAAAAALLCLGVAVGVATAAASSSAHRPDVYDEVVARADRSKADHERDAIDHPAEILRLAGIRPGMAVADILAADGYYSELASRLVGPKGRVLLLNNAAFEKWSNGDWAKRLADGRLPNVEHRVAELEQMQLSDASFDAVLLVKVYHDLYWVEPGSGWPPVDVPKVLDQVRRAVKPGGVVVVVDHSAKAGAGSGDAGRIHRIEEAFTRRQFESLGFELVGQSDVLRHPEDSRDLVTYKGEMLGKTDRFVLVFRKKRM